MTLTTRQERAEDLDDFDYALPPRLIAQYPLPDRSASRLLCLAGASGELRDAWFPQVVNLLAPGDVLVFNDTRVIPARLYGRKTSGGRVEFLVERMLDAHTVLALAGSNKALRIGQQVRLEKGGTTAAAVVIGRSGDLFGLRFEEPVRRVLGELGHVPLPPYIRREAGALDRERYQTVFARKPGAVAAPTAGLHFDRRLIESLGERGVRCVFLTLHVGPGTFQPVRTRDIVEHRLHAERFIVPAATWRAVAAAKRARNRVVAVGTTCVRALETLAERGESGPRAGETDLFIRPGYRFRLVDAMITNFHLPRSSLLMLVCAFAGTAHTLNGYRHAVGQGYRFYSYGDAMWVTPRPDARAC